MPLHRLAALFEPSSLLVLGDRALPIARDVPESLKDSITFAAITAQSIQVPAKLNGVASGARLDLVLLCIDPRRFPEALEAVRTHRPRAIALLAASASSADPIEDIAYCQSWARLNDCLILGPRSFGVQRPPLKLNFSHASNMALPGRVALLAQSRSIVAAVMDWAADINMGFSTIVSLGDEAVVTIPEVLNYLAGDAHTDSIALYLDAISSSRELISALRAAASVKPVVVLKSGHGLPDSDRVEDAVFDALLRRVGAVRIRYFVQLFSALKVLGYKRRPQGRRIALFSNGNGPSQLALDVMGPNTAVLRADLSMPTIRSLRNLLEPGAAVQNPVITHAPLEADKVRPVIDALLADTGVDGVLVLLAPDPLADIPQVAKQVVAIMPEARKPIVTCFMGDAGMRPLRHLLDSAGTPAFRTPESAANAFGILASYHYNQVLSQQILPPEPLSRAPEIERARDLVRTVRNAGRHDLTLAESIQLFDCFNIPIEAPADPADVGRNRSGDALLMAIRVNQDARFGPFIKFGQGGQDAPISSNDRGIDLPPLNGYLARQLIERSALWRRVLSRQMTPTAFACLQEALERISDLICELPGIDSMVIDPLFADTMRLSAASVRIRLTASPLLVLPETSGYRHMAIHPYPRRLTRMKTSSDGKPWVMRPIRPEDAQPLQTFMRNLSDESRYMRFVSMLRELTPRMLARYTRIDYDRELALVATVQAPNPRHRGHPQEQIVGFAHYLRNADGRGAEYALVIGDDWQRRGLGAELMRGLIEAAQEQGLTYIEGMVLTANRPMLGLMARLGFQNDDYYQDSTMRRVWFDLGETRRSKQ